MATVLTSSIVVALAYLAAMATLAIVAALRAGGRREDTSDEGALASSRFTIPVSVLMPVTSGSRSVSRSIGELLDLNYPELEVIVVADGAPQAIEAIRGEWQLEAREFFYRKTIETAEVHRIYKSGRDQRLMVIDKAAGGSGSTERHSDALNCGINVARYRYVMSVGPDVRFDRDALLRVMTPALRDPASVVGASNHVERGADTVVDQSDGRSGLSGLFQRLASARALMDSRLAWRHLAFGLGPAGGVMVWRRDAVIKAKGFSATAADSDLDMMLRLQTGAAEGAGRFDRGVDVFGVVQPQPMRRVLAMAARRQHAALEILGSTLLGRARSFEFKTLAYFVASEIVTPIAQAWIVGATAFGAAVGLFSWIAVFAALVSLSFGNAAVTAAALLLRGAAAGAPDASELRRLLAASPVEFVLYRPALAAARVIAALTFVARLPES